MAGARNGADGRTLQLWTQLVGKTQLALAPMTNHWWHVTLRVSPRGLSTSLGKLGISVSIDPLAVEIPDLAIHGRLRTDE